MNDTETAGALVVVASLTPMMVFGEGGADPVLSKIEAEVRAHKPDISTPGGRQAIASLAYKVARSKTALDEMGKTLVADWKAKAAAVDGERRAIRDRLDALKDECRKPLTDWEQAEKDRVAGHEAEIAEIASLSVFQTDPSVAACERGLAALDSMLPRDWQEFRQRADDASAATRAKLTTMLEAAQKREAEAAELERLRREEEARKKHERDAAIARQAAETARREAEEKAAAEARAVAERAEAERRRIEREKEAAEARARAAEERAEADRKAAAERERRAEEARIAAENKAKADAKAAAERADREKEAAIAAERKRVATEQARVAAEMAKREADKKHRARINNAVLASLVTVVGLDAEQAQAVVVAIASSKIPHAKITYTDGDLL